MIDPIYGILNLQVVSLPLWSTMEVTNFCAVMDTLVDQDVPMTLAPLTPYCSEDLECESNRPKTNYSL